jgi:hypothetical protein
MDKINKIINFEIKQIGEESDRILQFVGSDETPDRDNDIIEVAGWKLENYMKNPVFIWAHEYDQPPIGKAVNVMIDAGAKKLLFDVKFPTAEEYPFADTIYKLYKGGYLNATSVGFHGMKHKTRDEEAVLNLPEWQRGRRYMEQELLELSAVPVPANPNALMSIRSKGFTDVDIGKIFTEELKEVDLLVDSNSKEVFISENGIKTAKVKISDEYLEKLLEPIDKSGATLSKKTKVMLDEIHGGLAGCGDRLRKFIDAAGMMEDEPPGGMPMEPMATAMRTADMEQIKTALEEIKSQVLSLCEKSAEKDASKAVIDLDAIEFVKSSVPPDEPEITPDELKKIISESIKTYFEGGN